MSAEAQCHTLRQFFHGERSIAKVALYNLWERGSRFPRNGYYVVRYYIANGTYRMGEVLRDFKANEAEARAYAALWNGPEIDALVNGSKSIGLDAFAKGVA